MYCVKCKKDSPNKSEQRVVSANGRHMIKAICAKCGCRKNSFCKSGGAMKPRKGKKGGNIISDILGLF